MFTDQLSEKIWKTKIARFTASRRMYRNHVASTLSVALLSATIIGLNVISFMPSLKECTIFVTAATTILSVFVLVMSLLVSLMRYELKGKNYHECGMELDALYEKILLYKDRHEQKDEKQGDGENNFQSNDESLLNEYNSILKKYNLNHTNFDYHYATVGYNKDFTISFSELTLLKFRWYVWDVYLLYYAVAIVPLLVMLGVIVVKIYNC